MSALLEALVNTLPPAIAIVALMYMLLRWGPGLNAATRYAVWCVTLLAVLALPALTRIEPLINKPYRRPVIASRLPNQPASARPLNSPLRVANSRTVPLIALVWVAGSMLMLLRLAASYRSLRRLKRQASPMPLDTPDFQRPLRVLVSPRLRTPIAAGFLHPAIVVPADLATRLSASELDDVLIHEYAHLARRDDWVNLAGRLLQALVWFHPLAWFCLRQIAHERELACDDWVVHRTGNARAYAATLLKLTELRQTDRLLALATGILGGKSQLAHRIEELLRFGHRFVPAVSRWRLALATLFVSVLAFGSLPELPTMIKFQRRQSTPAPPQPRQSFLAGLQAAGYGHLDVDEIIELHNHGIPPSYMAEVSSLTGKLSPKQFIQLRSHGVQAADVRRSVQMQSGAVTIDEIIRHKTSGILDRK